MQKSNEKPLTVWMDAVLIRQFRVWCLANNSSMKEELTRMILDVLEGEATPPAYQVKQS